MGHPVVYKRNCGRNFKDWRDRYCQELSVVRGIIIVEMHFMRDGNDKMLSLHKTHKGPLAVVASPDSLLPSVYRNSMVFILRQVSVEDDEKCKNRSRECNETKNFIDLA